MSIMVVSNKKEFLDKLKKNGYDEVSTFLVYPNADANNVIGTGAYASVEMSEEFVNSDDFVRDINTDSGIIFIGLNYAQREDGYDGKAFQTMHDSKNKQSKDNNIALSLIDMHGANKTDKSDKSDDVVKYSVSLDQSEAYGSFAFDIINKFACTNLKGFVGSLVKELKKNAPAVNTAEDFDMSKVENGKCDDILSNCTDPEHKEKEPNKCPSCHPAILNKLMDRLVKYDIPSFINLINWTQPKGLICFGTDSYKLVSAINDIYHLNLNVQQAIHYSAQRSYYDKRNSVYDAVKNIVK